MGLFHSHDLGESWEVATEGVPNHWKNTTYWVAPDPGVKDLLWGAFSYAHDLPRNKMWRANGPREISEGGVCVSNDGGKRGASPMKACLDPACTHILLDPKSLCRFPHSLTPAVSDAACSSPSTMEKSWALQEYGGIEKNRAVGVAYHARRRWHAVPRSPRGANPRSPLGGDGDGAIYASTDGC